MIAIGEVLGYVGSAKGTKAELRDLFGRVRSSLRPGGLFVFDLATPGRVPAGEDSAFRVGEDWAILYTAQEDSKGRKLQRRITTFRTISGGATYRRSEEVHRLRLWPARGDRGHASRRSLQGPDAARLRGALVRARPPRVRRADLAGARHLPQNLLGFVTLAGVAPWPSA